MRTRISALDPATPIPPPSRVGTATVLAAVAMTSGCYTLGVDPYVGYYLDAGTDADTAVFVVGLPADSGPPDPPDMFVFSDGLGPVDTGAPVFDGGIALPDAGPGVFDGGIVPPDAGPAVFDGGIVAPDAGGEPTPDAG